MKAVFDPNVMVSALLSRHGTPAILLRLWLDGAFELVTSPHLLAELERVLAYPKIRARITTADAEGIVVLLKEGATFIDDPGHPPTLRSPDPHDDYLIGLAEAGRAVIVSGDNHLLQMVDRLPVYSPAGFRQLLGTHESQ